MIKSYFNSAYRNLFKNKVSSIINILGLAIGMVASILIIQYVRFEYSYDKFHENSDNIYRVQTNRYDKGILSTQWSNGAAFAGKFLFENFPEITNFTRFRSTSGIISYEDRSFKEENIYYVDTSFFEIFSFDLLVGDQYTCLSEPNKAVISQSTAKKYYGDEDPIGKILSWNKYRDYIITGVFEDVPENSHLKFDILFSWETYVDVVGADRVNDAWFWDGFYNYVTLADGTDQKAFEEKVPPVIDEKIGEAMAEFNTGVELVLQPVKWIHLNSNFIGEHEVNGNGRNVSALLIISIFLLIIAWINYINLSTAHSLQRAGEVGIRKVSGAIRKSLIIQFLIESILINMIAAIMAIIIVSIVYPHFNFLTGKQLDFSFMNNIGFWGAIALAFIAGAFLSGFYPSFLLSSYKPVKVLKGKLKDSKSGIWLRKGLVVFQFIISIVLIASTLTVYKQVNYMNSQDLGVNIDQTLVLAGPRVGVDSTFSTHFESFKQQLLGYNSIKNVATSTNVPGRKVGNNAGGVRMLYETAADSKQLRVLYVDYDYIDNYDIKLVAGRSFSQEYGTDINAIILNEAGARLMGFTDYDSLMQEQLYYWGDTCNIVGVSSDFHHHSLKEDPEPLIIRVVPVLTRYFSLKVEEAGLQNTIAYVQDLWDEYWIGNPFEYFFLDDYFMEQYNDEMRFGKVFAIFSIIAIIIACLGLFGLSSFSITQRTKEIGIRKAAGASASRILRMLMMEFLRHIYFAGFIAIPLSAWFMIRWLNNFAMKVQLGWWFYLIPIILISVIAAITVSYQVIRTANANPAESLRYE